MLWRPDFDAGFETWWKSYPRREGGKFSAEQAYQRALLKATPEELFAGVERYKAHLPEDMRYVLTPAKWLEKGCWLDEYDDPPVRAEEPACDHEPHCHSKVWCRVTRARARGEIA